MEAYGSKFITQHHGTPNLDSLTKQGVSFMNAHAQISLCGPSRATILTGLRPDTHRVFDLDPDALFLSMKRAEQAKSPFLLVPTMFKLAGYRTLSMGKIFHTAEFKLADSEEVWSEPSWTRNAGKRPPALPTSFGREWLNSRDVPDDTYADGVLARLAAKMILEDLGTQPSVNTSKQPWFLGVGFYKPHIPFEAPKRYFDLAGNLSDYPATYGDGTIGNLVKSQSDIAKGAGCTEMSEYVNSPKSLGFPFKTNANVLREASRGYHASVMYMDAQLGIVLNALKKSSASNNTIIIFMGDHGFHLGDHGLYCKHTNFEQATKVPFIIASPLRDLTAKRNARSFAPVELLDFAPTLLEMAGLQPERYSKYREFEGKSLMPILNDPENGHVKKVARSQYHRRLSIGRRIYGTTIRTTRYRMTTWGAPDPFVEVYDYLEDAGETVSLHQDEALVRKLKAQIKDDLGESKPFDFDDRLVMANKPPSDTP